MAIAFAVLIGFGVAVQFKGSRSQAAEGGGWPYTQFERLDRGKPVLVELSAAW